MKKILDFPFTPVISYTYNMSTSMIPQPIKNLKHYLLAQFYCKRYLNPSKKLKVIGVTGSDGKTTTSNIIYSILKNANFKVGSITTLNVRTQSKEFPLDFHVTNPAPKDLQRILRMMVEEGLEYVILETTSHGLDQYRVAGIKYDFAIYTNVTHEHLDYHKTYENYLRTKGKLINYTGKDGTVVLNKDDESFKYLFDLATNLEREIITYGFSNGCDIQADEFVKEDENMSFTLKMGNRKTEYTTNLRGRYNIYNLMASISVVRKLGVPTKKIKESILKIPQMEGRWEVLKEKPFQVIVDFAHTPNALENVLKRGDQLREKGKKLIVVFGCAGKRDKTKRPKMGYISGKYADSIILTAEDPRGEDVKSINREIIEGIKETQSTDVEYFSIANRKSAIKKALNIAKKGDVVIVTGKGHEKSMNLDGKKESPWHEKEIVLKLLKR